MRRSEWIAELGAVWSLACQDLRRWRRMPLAVASAVTPPLGMALLLVVLSLSVTQQPVALVVQARGPSAARMERLLTADTDAYALTVTSARKATEMLASQQVAAVVTIPQGFDQSVASHAAQLRLTLNNVDIDFADDIRRSIERSAGRFDAPGLGVDDAEEMKGAGGFAADAPNPYRVFITERDLRKTNVDFLHYQVLPVLVLLVLTVGLMGTAMLVATDAERGTARLLAAAPVSGTALVAGRLLGGLLASLVALVPATALCVLARIITPPAGHWPALIALLLATGLCASGLGAALGAIIPGVRTVALASSVLAIYLFFLGGGFTTIAFLPAWVRAVSAFDPARYAIDGLRQALFYPDLTGLPLDLGVLTATAAAAVLVGALLVRRSWAR